MTRTTEHKHQKSVIEWASIMRAQYPELRLLLAIPNGGHRDVRVGRKLKAEGVRAGVPDLFLPVARGKYHGLFVELKALDGRLSDSQKLWRDALLRQGYQHVVAYGGRNAQDHIEAYLKQSSE